jgi:hypothetical protein
MTLQEKRATKSAHLTQIDAQEEIQKFVTAVRSYPALFASHPQITFEEHLMRVSEEADRRRLSNDREIDLLAE